MNIDLSIEELRCLREHIRDYNPIIHEYPADISKVRDKLDRAIASHTAVPVTFGTPAKFKPTPGIEALHPR